MAAACRPCTHAELPTTYPRRPTNHHPPRYSAVESCVRYVLHGNSMRRTDRAVGAGEPLVLGAAAYAVPPPRGSAVVLGAFVLRLLTTQ